jgi:23S rRNA pseudouridine1911/1915/1917 synthase
MQPHSKEVLWQHDVTDEEAGLMVKSLLKRHLALSRRMLRRLKYEQLIWMDGQPVYATARVESGQRLTVYLPANQEPDVKPQPLPLSILYEDQDLAVVDKPAGMVVHPTRQYQEGTLANAWIYHYGDLPFRPVTRLDRDTSGLLVVAKHAYAHAFLAKQMKQRRYQRTYQALVHGLVESEEGEISLPIGRASDSVIKRVIRWDEYGKPALTRYRVLERWKTTTHVELTLGTGRTHQIRVHMAAIGHPLCGDTLYGEKKAIFPRQALHAAHLSLLHPRQRQRMSWTSALPDDIKKMIVFLREQ